MRILSADDVRAALSMTEAIERMREAFAALARGDVEMPARSHVAAPDAAGVTLIMPARIAGRALAVKVVSVFDRNPARRLPKIQAAVLVLDPETGRPRALLEGGALTAIRTAAASGLATDLLAPADAVTLAVFGAGVQARSHIEAMCAVRPVERIRVYSRTPARVDELITDLADAPWMPDDVARADRPGTAVREASIVCATTTSATPVFDDADLGPGTHVNAVGSFTPGAREVPGATVARAWVVVDQREAAWAEAGELVLARDAGRIKADHVKAELGELVLNPDRPDLRPGDPDAITLFKSVGVAVQDAAAAAAVCESAERDELGMMVTW